jgi:hypothetical protein
MSFQELIQLQLRLLKLARKLVVVLAKPVRGLL